GFQIEWRAADEQYALATALDVAPNLRRALQPPGHAGGFPRVQDIDEVVGHSAAIFAPRLGRADVHAAIQGHRIHRNDLSAPALGLLHAEPTLARAGCAGKDDRVLVNVEHHR